MKILIPMISFLLLYFSCITEISSQVKVTSNNNVGVGTDNPHSSAKLEVHSENQGFLKPRMTTSQRNAINNPSVGLEVFDIDDNLTYWFNGTVWVTHGPGSGTGGTIVIAGTGIQVEGDGTSLSPYEIINTMQPNSESINGVISLLYNSETASSEHVNSTSNSSILSSYSIGTHSYDKVIIEAIVKSRVDNNVSRRTSFLWRFFRDNTLIDAYTCKILSDNTTGITGGGTYTNTLTAIVDGSEVQNVTLGITVQMDYAGNQTGGLVESFRVYGVADVELEGIVGPEGPEGPEGPAGQGGLTVEGANINVEGTGILGDPYVIINTFVEQDASITNEIQTLSTNLTPGHLHLTQSGTITLNVDDDDADPDNELQTLSINGNVLSISDKNSVTLPTGNNSATDLSYSGSSSPITLHSSTGTDVTITAGTEIGISGTASNITITNTYNDPDDDPGNEIQTLSTNNQPGNITLNPSGGTLNINVNDADASTSNEIQTLSINGNALTISHNGGNTVNLPAPGVGGGGTENYVAKFGPNGNNVINSELLNWTGVLATNSSLGVGTTNPNHAHAKLHVSGRIAAEFPAGTGGLGSIAFGFGSGNDSQTGQQNVCIGNSTGSNLSSGNFNMFLGSSSGYNNTSGEYNTFLGAFSGPSTSGHHNIAIGRAAGGQNTGGDHNVWIGRETGYVATAGVKNTYIGNQAGYYLYGDNNTCVGHNAGGGGSGYGETGNNTCIGAFSSVTSQYLTNATALGFLAIVDSSNKVRVGNANVSRIGGVVGWTQLSDSRYKLNIRNNVPGLNFINQLNPVTYQLDTRKVQENEIRKLPDSLKGNYLTNLDFSSSSSIFRTGFLAQEVDSICKTLGYDFDGISKGSDPEDQYSITYTSFIPPLVKAIQEQQVQINDKNNLINDLEIRLNNQTQLAKENENKYLELKKALDDLTERVRKLE